MSDLLDLALKAHGGLDRWHEVKSLDVRVSLTGALYHLKGYPEGVPNVTVRIDTRRPAVTVSPYARPDHRGHFTPDRVWIEDCAGHIVDERRNPRASFAGHVRETPWDQLHRLYKGIVFPTLRRVLRRPPSGPLVNGPTAVLIQITDVLLGEGDCG